MAMLFIWDEYNEQHINKHNVDRDEAEYVVRTARPPFPEDIGLGKHLVRGASGDGQFLQVIFVYRESEDVDVSQLSVSERIVFMDDPEIVYVIHARPLTEREKRYLRRRKRQ